MNNFTFILTHISLSLTLIVSPDINHDTMFRFVIFYYSKEYYYHRTPHRYSWLGVVCCLLYGTGASSVIVSCVACVRLNENSPTHPPRKTISHTHGPEEKFFSIQINIEIYWQKSPQRKLAKEDGIGNLIAHPQLLNLLSGYRFGAHELDALGATHWRIVKKFDKITINSYRHIEIVTWSSLCTYPT